MIKIVVIILCFRYGMMEPPVNTYLPTGRVPSPFSKTYAPPTHNVSFNFGFSSSKTKNKSFIDSSGYDSAYSSARRDNKNSYGSGEMNGKFGSNPDMTQLVYKNSHDTTKNLHLAKDSYANKNINYNTPNDLPNIQSHSTYGSDMMYPLSTQNDLPEITENKFARKLIEPPNAFMQFQASKSGAASGMNSFAGYSPSIGNSESDLTQNAGSSYDFSYEVISPESGVNQGHRESFDGKNAEGIYHNLLPDGRLLTVEYWADDSGFKPRLSYKIFNPNNDYKNEGPY